MFTDNFTYGGTPTAAEPLSSRAGWTLLSGTATTISVGNGGTSLNHNATADTVVLCPDQGSANHYTQVVLLGVQGFVCVRLANLNSYIGFRHSGTAFQVYKNVAGTFVQLGSDYVAALSGSNVCRLTAAGNTITFEVDGVPRCGSPFTDAFNSSQTRQGVISRGSGAFPWLDDFEADAVAVDTTPPTLTSPVGTTTGSTTASGSVSTNEGNGTLYRLANTSATATVAEVKAAGLTQAVTAPGTQSVSFTGLIQTTTYYAHYVHMDSSGNDSTRVSSASFTTLAAPATATTLSGPSGGQVSVASAPFTVGANGAITGTVTVTPSDGGGGGTFSPTSVAISSGTPTATFTYTPGSVGAKTISISDTGSLTDAAPLSYTAALTAGTITVSGIRNGSGTLLAATTLPNVVVIQRNTRAVLLALTAQTTNGAGALTITSGALAAGTACLVVAFSDDGTQAGAWAVTAA